MMHRFGKHFKYKYDSKGGSGVVYALNSPKKLVASSSYAPPAECFTRITTALRLLLARLGRQLFLDEALHELAQLVRAVRPVVNGVPAHARHCHWRPLGEDVEHFARAMGCCTRSHCNTYKYADMLPWCMQFEPGDAVGIREVGWARPHARVGLVELHQVAQVDGCGDQHSVCRNAVQRLLQILDLCAWHHKSSCMRYNPCWQGAQVHADSPCTCGAHKKCAQDLA